MEDYARELQSGKALEIDGVSFATIATILNNHSEEDIILKLNTLRDRDAIKAMIHEQYFYGDYPGYQPGFEEKLRTSFAFLQQNRYTSKFFEELIQ